MDGLIRETDGYPDINQPALKVAAHRLQPYLLDRLDQASKKGAATVTITAPGRIRDCRLPAISLASTPTGTGTGAATTTATKSTTAAGARLLGPCLIHG